MRIAKRQALILLAVVGFFSTIPGFAHERIPSESGNYCKDEANEFIRYYWGPRARFHELKKLGNGTQWEYWGEANFCRGNFVFIYLAQENFGCSQAQLDRRSRFLMQVYATDDCRRLLPHQAFPPALRYWERNLDTTVASDVGG